MREVALGEESGEGRGRWRGAAGWRWGVAVQCTMNTKRFPAYGCHTYIRPHKFGRSEQEHKQKRDENKSAKHGLTAFKDQITLQLRLSSWKHPSGNRAV